MTYRTILVVIADDDALESRLQIGCALANRFGAVLIGMHVIPPIVADYYDEGAGYIGPELIEAQREANRRVNEQVCAKFQEICGGAPNAIWQEGEGDRGRLLAEAAHATDLVLAGRSETGGTHAIGMVNHLVTATGIPVLALPVGSSSDFGQTVLVAWNGSREAARAVHDALPFFGRAKNIHLCSVGDEAGRSVEAAAEMLRRHDLSVNTLCIDEEDAAAGEVLLAQAAAQGADLLVMGAYGHGRLRELVFGGATRHVLRQATLPVLFSG